MEQKFRNTQARVSWYKLKPTIIIYIENANYVALQALRATT